MCSFGALNSLPRRERAATFICKFIIIISLSVDDVNVYIGTKVIGHFAIIRTKEFFSSFRLPLWPMYTYSNHAESHPLVLELITKMRRRQEDRGGVDRNPRLVQDSYIQRSTLISPLFLLTIGITLKVRY